MNTFYYEVISIDGDYANLKRTDIESNDLKLVARALLPPETAEGMKLNTSGCSMKLSDESADGQRGSIY